MKKTVLIVGFGSIGQRYYNLLAKNKNFDVSVYSKYLASSPKVSKEKLKIKLCEYRMLNSKTFDLIIICSENKKHILDLLKFESFTQKILVEKPLSHQVVPRNTMKKLLALNKQIYVSSPLRFHKGFAELESSIGKIGHISGVIVVCKSWLPDWRPGRSIQNGFWNQQSQGGVVLELIHEIDYMNKLFKKFTFHSKLKSKFSGLALKVDSGVDALFRGDGFNINLRLDFSSREKSRYIRIDGGKGFILWDIITGRFTLSTQTEKKVVNYKSDLNRDEILMRQIKDILNRKGNRASTLREANEAMLIAHELRRNN
jgi:predicted dehydrogenase